MRLPRGLARFNKRATNRVLIRLADRPPYCALRHTGRRTGRIHRTPLNAFPLGDRFVFALTYGPTADWVQNVFAAGTAVLEYDGENIALTSPELIPRTEAWKALPMIARIVLRALGTREFLSLDRLDTANRPS